MRSQKHSTIFLVFIWELPGIQVHCTRSLSTFRKIAYLQVESILSVISECLKIFLNYLRSWIHLGQMCL
jgi:hypothetical protein